jgi:hypothetical protein
VTETLTVRRWRMSRFNNLGEYDAPLCSFRNNVLEHAASQAIEAAIRYEAEIIAQKVDATKLDSDDEEKSKKIVATVKERLERAYKLCEGIRTAWRELNEEGEE